MLNMGRTIRERRHALGLTQEQAAQRLGVSAAAVSKWELGASYPDVLMLPALARLLEIDLNTLMGFEHAPDAQTIAHLLEQVSHLARETGMDAAMARAQEILRTYPACGALLFGLAATLEGWLMMSGKDREAYERVLLDWYARAAKSGDQQARESAAHMLAAKYLGRRESEKAQEMMDLLPREPQLARWPLEVSYLLAKGDRQQAHELLQNTLFRRAGDMQQILLRMIQAAIDEGDLPAGQALADLTQAFVELLCMHPYTGHLAQLMPALERRDAGACMTHIRAMLAALRTPWSPGECLPYARSGVKRDAKISSGMLAGIVREMQESPAYAFLREEAGLCEVLEAYMENRA